MALPNILKKITDLIEIVSGHITKKANKTVLGHVTLSDATDESSAASNGLAATPKAVKDAVAAGASAVSGHADDVASGSVLGHVKLSDAVNSTSGVAGGIAATPLAVKTAYDKGNAALPKAGGTMTGNITMADGKGIVLDISGSAHTLGTYSNIPIQVKTKNTAGTYTYSQYPLFEIPSAQTDNYGMGLGIGCGGLTVVGGGESARNLVGNLGIDGSTEKLVLASDNGIDIYTNCGTVANKKQITIGANASISTPGSVTATGGFIGNASTATLASKATNDANGKAITSYIQKAALHSTVAKAGYTFTNGAGTASTIDLPAASTTAAGVVNNAEQTWVGNKTISGNAVGFGVTNGTHTVRLQIGSAKVNRGLYDSTLGDWMVYADASKVHLNGNAATATKLATARKISLTDDVTGSVTTDFGAAVSIATTIGNTFAKKKYLAGFTSDHEVTATSAYYMAVFIVTNENTQESDAIEVTVTGGSVIAKCIPTYTAGEYRSTTYKLGAVVGKANGGSLKIKFAKGGTTGVNGLLIYS